MASSRPDSKEDDFTVLNHTGIDGEQFMIMYGAVGVLMVGVATAMTKRKSLGGSTRPLRKELKARPVEIKSAFNDLLKVRLAPLRT